METKSFSEAVRSQKIIKQPCEICGSMDNIQGHHSDYTKPLDVVWLCRLHHQQLHNKIRKEQKETKL